MNINPKNITPILDFMDRAGLLPRRVVLLLGDMARGDFAFQEQLYLAESIHLHIKVEAVDSLPHELIATHGGQARNAAVGYIKYCFPEGLNIIFSSIPVSEEEKSGQQRGSFPYLDHIGIDIRKEDMESKKVFGKIPCIASFFSWPVVKQSGEGKKVSCCHVQVDEKYWVYPTEEVFYEFALGKLHVSEKMFGCDLRPAHPSLNLPKEQSCCCPDSSAEERIAQSCTGDKPVCIGKNCEVTVSFMMRKCSGEVLEERTTDNPITYTHGIGEIMRSLESALEGATKGDERTIKLAYDELGLGCDCFIDVKVLKVMLERSE
ncbi:peptidylprolyl isomerase [Echinicola rosea]|uniref:Uncharacterized protein n=1 Tax=Echinicola rosea TaxID=1807691 RepID=A0ABQ1UUG2_9BACT|nr:hypothetical protein [Echinicola rosea]GGF25515.1 hypothetical protein GCM10011339_12010 [Echinicola rosea]